MKVLLAIGWSYPDTMTFFPVCEPRDSQLCQTAAREGDIMTSFRDPDYATLLPEAG